MGGKISKEIWADHLGQRVYFCCEACIDEFRDDPEKYMKKLEAMGQKAEKIG
jgi:YHS domain-containing protein